MYYRFFGLDGPPFAITPDPKFVFFSERHQEALAHLLYGVDTAGGGFVQLTGEVGTGKTTLCRLFLEEAPEAVHPALILNPVLGPRELIATVCEELGIRYPVRATRKALLDLLNRRLLDIHAEGGRAVLVVDEAQNLSPQALEQIRLLTNLETRTSKLLQVILIGQPELRDVLDRPGLRQLAQRVTARYHLEPLDAEEAAAYVRHRLAVAGAPRCPFTASGLAELHRRASGVPRLVNVIADRALLAAFTDGRERVGPRLVRRAATEVLGNRRAASRRRWRLAAAVPVAAALAAAALVWAWRFQPGGEPALAVPAGAAWSEAAGWWDADWPRDRAPGCATARDAGLACLRATGSWSDLRRLAVPFLLKLDGDGADPRWVTARRATGAGLSVLGGDSRLSRAAVEGEWGGEYVVLVRLPDRVPATLEPGDTGPGVAWLRERIASLDPAFPQEGDEYEETTEQWVADFQRRAGLPVTGIADAATLVLVAAHSGSETG